MENRYRKARDPVERSHYQIVWLISEGKSTAEVMEATGYSRGSIQRLARRYNSENMVSMGMGNEDSLQAPRERLAHYVRQDFQYQTVFCQVYWQAISKCTNRKDIAFCNEQISFVLDSENHPHRGYSRSRNSQLEGVSTVDT